MRSSAWMVYAGVAVIAVVTARASWSLWQQVRRSDPYAPESQPIPVKRTLSADLTGRNHKGQEASFSAVKGKVSACSYLFTRCPHGCAIVFGAMRELRDNFGTHPDFHLASIAVLPDLDTPDIIRDFAVSQGVTPADPWLFLTGFQRQEVWDFMQHQLLMDPTRETPVRERLSSCDYCEHDLRIVLIDRKGQVRGHYAVMQTKDDDRRFIVDKMISDTRRLLDGGD